MASDLLARFRAMNSNLNFEFVHVERLKGESSCVEKYIIDSYVSGIGHCEISRIQIFDVPATDHHPSPITTPKYLPHTTPQPAPSSISTKESKELLY